MTGSSSTGGAQRSRCLPPGPLGGGWGRQGAASVRARCRAHGGQEAVAWQPSGQRGHASATPYQRCRDRSAGGCADWRYLGDHSCASHVPPAAEPRSTGGRRWSRRGLPPRSQGGTARAAEYAGAVRAPPRWPAGGPGEGHGAYAPPRPLQRQLSGGGRDTAVSCYPDTVQGCTCLGWETAWPGTSNTPMSSRRGGTP